MNILHAKKVPIHENKSHHITSQPLPPSTLQTRRLEYDTLRDRYPMLAVTPDRHFTTHTSGRQDPPPKLVALGLVIILDLAFLRENYRSRLSSVGHHPSAAVDRSDPFNSTFFQMALARHTHRPEKEGRTKHSHKSRRGCCRIRHVWTYVRRSGGRLTQACDKISFCACAYVCVHVT